MLRSTKASFAALASEEPALAALASQPPAPDLRSAAQADPLEDDLAGLLARTVERELIPRLMLVHRVAPECGISGLGSGVSMTAADVEQLVRLLLAPEEELAMAAVAAMRVRGAHAEDICLRLLAPAARRLGELWTEDLCSFGDVTYGLGRLHRILREFGPAFEQSRDAPANGLRVLLLPVPGEQHTFGLAMVAEFFRREGWEVEVGLDAGGTDAVACVRSAWFDLVGYSISSPTRVDALKQTISRVRRVSLNTRLGIMVGGPLFCGEPDGSHDTGADLVARNGAGAPALATSLVGAMAQLRWQ
jgi:MerR family transcriptional regulator, light-induced transcriptional regulator